MMKFIKRLFCKHIFHTVLYSYRCYDEELWIECTKCGKALELGEYHD